MNITKLKIFQIDDFEWWCSHMDIEEFTTWYMKEHGLTEDECSNDVVEVTDLENEGIYWTYMDEVNKARLVATIGALEEIGKYGEIGSIITRDGELKECISFKKAIELNGEYTEPYCIACM